MLEKLPLPELAHTFNFDNHGVIVFANTYEITARSKKQCFLSAVRDMDLLALR